MVQLRSSSRRLRIWKASLKFSQWAPLPQQKVARKEVQMGQALWRQPPSQTFRRFSKNTVRVALSLRPGILLSLTGLYSKWPRLALCASIVDMEVVLFSNSSCSCCCLRKQVMDCSTAVIIRSFPFDSYPLPTPACCSDSFLGEPLLRCQCQPEGQLHQRSLRGNHVYLQSMGEGLLGNGSFPPAELSLKASPSRYEDFP